MIHDAKKSKPGPAETLAHVLVPLLERLSGDVSQLVTRGGVPITGAEARPIITTGQKVSASPTRIAGWALRETTGTGPATVLLYDGNTDGEMLIPITLAAGESVRDWLGPRGVSFPNGIYASVALGSVDGSVFVFAGQAIR